MHHFLSYRTQTKTTTTLYLPLHALQTINPPPLTQLKLHHLLQAHFTVKVSYINVSHMQLHDFFNTQIWFLVVFFCQCVTSSSSLLADLSNHGLDEFIFSMEFFSIHQYGSFLISMVHHELFGYRCIVGRFVQVTSFR